MRWKWPWMRVWRQDSAVETTQGRRVGKSGAARHPYRTAGSGRFEIVLIISVLGALCVLAYPSFVAYDTRANRAAAQSFMLELANAQARYQAVHRRYATGPQALPELGYPHLPEEVADHYVVIVEPLRGPPAGFHILAMPRGTQARRDTACATLSLTHTGARAVSGRGTNCWGQ